MNQPIYPEALDALFKDFLDGKTARVSTKGLSVAGAMEGYCKLKYQRFFGLELQTQLKWNRTKVMDALKAQIFNRRSDIGLTYNNTDKLLPALQEVIDDLYVVAGNISPYNVESWSTILGDKGEIRTVTIKYSNGNVVELTNIVNS